MNTPDNIAPDPSPGVYIPGHAAQKVMMILFGIMLLTLGLVHLWQPLRLFAFGSRVRAEAVSITKTKQGLPDLVLTDDVEVQSKLEPHDRSYIFWNEFRFLTADGTPVTVRATVGSQLKPLYTLLDPDGLPTTDLVCYDPANPGTYVFPMLIGTWFAPGVLVVIGTICTIIGSVLRYWANRPIELPHIPPPAAATGTGAKP